MGQVRYWGQLALVAVFILSALLVTERRDGLGREGDGQSANFNIQALLDSPLKASRPAGDSSQQRKFRQANKVGLAKDSTSAERDSLAQNGRDWLSQLQEDEFQSGHPFQLLKDRNLLDEIVSRGVIGFARDTYRSGDFGQGLGYDIVKYEVETQDGKTHFVLAYREKTAPAQTGVGLPDLRPTSMAVLMADDEGYQIHAFQNGSEVGSVHVEQNVALREVFRRLEHSTPLLTSRDPQSVK